MSKCQNWLHEFYVESSDLTQIGLTNKEAILEQFRSDSIENQLTDSCSVYYTEKVTFSVHVRRDKCKEMNKLKYKIL